MSKSKIKAMIKDTEGGGLVCECTVECTLGVQLSGIACLTEKTLQCALNRHLLQVAGVYYKRSRDCATARLEKLCGENDP